MALTPVCAWDDPMGREASGLSSMGCNKSDTTDMHTLAQHSLPRTKLEALVLMNSANSICFSRKPSGCRSQLLNLTFSLVEQVSPETSFVKIMTSWFWQWPRLPLLEVRKMEAVLFLFSPHSFSHTVTQRRGHQLSFGLPQNPHNTDSAGPMIVCITLKERICLHWWH